MRYLILGGTGFLLKSLVFRLLQSERNEVNVIARRGALAPQQGLVQHNFDITEPLPGDLKKVFDVDVVIVGFGVSYHQRVTSCDHGQSIDVQLNVHGFLNVYSFLAQVKPCRVVYLSSGRVYGDDSVENATENSIMRINPEDPLYGYSCSKIFHEWMVQRLHDITHHSICIIRIFSTYSVTEESPYILDNLARSIASTTEFRLRVNPKSKINFISTHEFVRILDEIIHSKLTGIFNIGSQGELELGELLHYLRSYYSLNYSFDRNNCIRHYFPNTHKIRQYLALPSVEVVYRDLHSLVNRYILKQEAS